MTHDTVLGLAGAVVGIALGVAGWRLGVRLAGPHGIDERARYVQSRAGTVSWLLTVIALMVMWGLVELHVVASAGAVIWAVFLFSLLSYVAAGAVLDRRF